MNVVNLKHVSDMQAELVVYVGRNPLHYGFGPHNSLPILANKWTHRYDLWVHFQSMLELVDTREESIERYHEWLHDEVFKYKAKPILKAFSELDDHTLLGCWCKPLDCHADRIVEVWTEWRRRG